MHINLPASLDFDAAGPLLDQIKRAKGSDLELNASRVARLGVACLQVMLSAEKTWKEDGHSLRVTDRSSAIDDFLRLMGADLPA
jgi:chemotaxis protein CheX